MKRKNEYKPLLFTTTLRSPERIKDFLSILGKYNGQVLTNELIDKIVFDLVSQKLYIPMYVRKIAKLKVKLNTDNNFSASETNTIIINSPQKHKEAGFDKGWPSRFDTWYKFLKELGFVYYEMNKSIEISNSGWNLMKANDLGYEHLEQQVFLSAFSKYQRNNPYRRINNSNKPLILLLKVIKELKNVYGNDCAGISIKEIPLLICWKDDDAVAIVEEIKKIRASYGFTPSDEFIYQICKNILDLTSDDEKRFKISNITHELPDEFIRKMRLTGLISIRGAGRFIDINSLENSKIDYIISHYSSLIAFSNERDYFDYMKTVDLDLISTERVLAPSSEEERTQFMKWVNQFDIDTLRNELKIVADNKLESKHNIFKFINGPLRLEFLTALTLQKQFANILVQPNYSIDDEGMPSSFAQGNTPDIVCMDETGNVLFEVTLLTGNQQCIREMPAIARHLTECKTHHEDSFSVILVPYIHPDTVEYSKFVKYKDNLDIIPLDIPTFSNEIITKESIRDYRKTV